MNAVHVDSRFLFSLALFNLLTFIMIHVILFVVETLPFLLKYELKS